MESEFYKFFVYLCEQKGVSRTRACIEALGEGSKNTYSRWEKGSAEPSLSSLRKLSKYFNVTIGELAGEIKDPATNEDDGAELTDKQKELIRLISRLTDQEVSLLLSQVKGIILGQ